ncbi:MAG: ASKHA domain-containing protein [Treponema sp.]|nr:ASKHA domain-containing protein [Treponema sp.]
MPTVFFVHEKKSIAVEQGLTILEAARRAGVTIESPCNAIGSCGKCRVHTGFCSVLACQTPVEKDLVITLPDYTGENQSLQILSRGSDFTYEKQPYISKRFQNGKTLVYGGETLLGEEMGDTTAEQYGLAVDIGTTTLVTALVDLCEDKTLAVESVLNPQTAYAQDVLGRIHFASQGEGLFVLHRVFLEALEQMIRTLTETNRVRREHIYEVVYSGNTTMLHLACGVDPVSLGQFPYRPKLFGGHHVSAEELGISPFGIIWLPPIISAFVGADITSGILASGLDEKRGATLFIDIGTNGEMVLAKDGNLAAASTAAGPAFEGMNISCGMRASRGAIASFCVHKGIPSYELIGGNASGDDPPAGICGSGLLDITGELLREGVIGKNGRFVPPETGVYHEALGNCMGQQDGKSAFFITQKVYLAQRDIRQIQLAKGAIRCGIEMLLARFSMKAEAIDSVEIAGSFGYHLKAANLLSIGLLPAAFTGKLVFLGNSSLTGGMAFLMHTGFRSKMIELVKRVDSVELVNDKAFERTFIKYLSF